jgi:hypothetical protein
VFGSGQRSEPDETEEEQTESCDVPTHTTFGVAFRACCQALAPLSCLAAEAYALARTRLGVLPDPSGSSLGSRPWPVSHQRIDAIAGVRPGRVQDHWAASVPATAAIWERSNLEPELTD